MTSEDELGGKARGGERSGVGSGVDDNGGLPDDSHFQLRKPDLIMPGVFLACIFGLLAVLILLGLAGCASSPAFPPAGPQQKTSAVVVNPNCVAACSAQVSQSTALEDIKNNTAPVTAGAQTQSTSQTSTQTVQPTISPAKTTTKTDGEDPKP
jgi:hypothetical protein